MTPIGNDNAVMMHDVQNWLGSEPRCDRCGGYQASTAGCPIEEVLGGANSMVLNLCGQCSGSHGAGEPCPVAFSYVNTVAAR